MSNAYLISTRATCDRKKVGAVLVKDRRIIATGYNGAASKMPDCDSVGHELKNIDGRDSCVRTLHAESNAIDHAGALAKHSILYTTVIPCYDCAKRIVNAGVTAVYYAEYYASRNTELVVDYFRNSICSLIHWNGEFITPDNVPDIILERAATIRRNRAVGSTP